MRPIRVLLTVVFPLRPRPPPKHVPEIGLVVSAKYVFGVCLKRAIGIECGGYCGAISVGDWLIGWRSLKHNLVRHDDQGGFPAKRTHREVRTSTMRLGGSLRASGGLGE